MAINIKNDRAIELARQVAELTDTTMTGAIIESLEQRLQLLTRSADREARMARIMAISADGATRWTFAEAMEFNDSLYDEMGLPT